MKTNETKHCIEEFQSWTVTFLCCTSSSIYSRSQQVVINACQSSQRFDDILPNARLMLPWSKFSFCGHTLSTFAFGLEITGVAWQSEYRKGLQRQEGREYLLLFVIKKKKNTKSKIALSRYNISSNTSHRFALFRYCTLHQYAVCLCSHVLFTPRPLALLMTETCTLARILPDLIFL